MAPGPLRQIRDVFKTEGIADIHEVRYHCGIASTPVVKAIDRVLADVEVWSGDQLIAFDRSRHGEIFNLLLSAPAVATDNPLTAALSAYDALPPDDRLAFHKARPWPALRAVAA